VINYPPRGLIANLVSPLNSSGRPDRDALTRLMGRLAGRAAGFLVGSVKVGEALSLSAEDRLQLFEAAAGACPEDAVLLFELTARGIDETLDLITRTGKLLKRLRPKAAVYYFLTPLVYHSNRKLPRHFDDLARNGPFQMVFSNNPDLVRPLRPRLRHQNIRTSIIKRLSANERIVGLEFDGDMARAINYQRALRQRAGFRFYDGNEHNFLNRPSSSGLISCGASLLPQAWADVVGMSLNASDSRRMRPDHLSRIWESGQAVRSMLDLYQPNPAGLIKTALTLMQVLPEARLAARTEPPTAGQKDKLKAGLNELSVI
jgi:dihydrodipicolinate synthase/N-acetylneuraminate lyase